MTPGRCYLCKRLVVWAVLDGKPAAVEKVDFGRGNIALTCDLVDPARAPEASRVTRGTGYRLHRPACPVKAEPPFRRLVRR